MSIRHLYNTTVSVSRKTRTGDTQGGYTESFGSVGDVKCRISPASASERQIARRDESYLTHVLYCDEEEDIQRGDKLTEDKTEREFVVINVRAVSIRNRHAQIDLEQRSRGR